MTTGTQKASAAVSPIPAMGNSPWKLEFTDGSQTPPGLERFDILTITRQEQNLDTLSISGFVTDTATETSFYPLNGQIDSELVVTFFVTIKNDGDKVYLFKGRVVEGTKERFMAGRFRIVEIGHANEDGNWSAQAQGGGDDDDDRPAPKPRHRRSR